MKRLYYTMGILTAGNTEVTVQHTVTYGTLEHCELVLALIRLRNGDKKPAHILGDYCIGDLSSEVTFHHERQYDSRLTY